MTVNPCSPYVLDSVLHFLLQPVQRREGSTGQERLVVLKSDRYMGSEVKDKYQRDMGVVQYFSETSLSMIYLVQAM